MIVTWRANAQAGNDSDSSIICLTQVVAVNFLLTVGPELHAFQPGAGFGRFVLLDN